MTLQSMTGFARISGAYADYSWLWEAKSVNGRGLEIRCRIPYGFDKVEESARKNLKSRLQRGTVNLHLQLNQSSGKNEYQVNHALLDELISVAKDKASQGGIEAARIDGLLGLKGVIEQSDKSNADDKEQLALEQALTNSLNGLFDNLLATRIEEGSQLLPVLNGQLDEIAMLSQKALNVAALRPENVRARINTQMEALLSGSTTIEADRLEQELAMLATKADISEELDRLASHVVTARDVLASDKDEGIGRRLDFICQEFNREANTLCSKSNDKELTQIGLDLKVIIDRLREQVQNIE